MECTSAEVETRKVQRFRADILQLHELRAVAVVLRMIHHLGEQESREVLVSGESCDRELAPLRACFHPGAHFHGMVHTDPLVICPSGSADLTEGIPRIGSIKREEN